MNKNDKLDLVPKFRFPEFLAKGDWDKDHLGELSLILRGGSPRPIDEFITNDANGLNWLKIGDVNKEAKFITQTTDKVKKTALTKTREVNPGDLIMSNSMSFGRPYILKIKTCIHDGWIAVTEIKDVIISDYLYYFILSSGSQVYFSNAAAGGGIKNLNADIIKLLPVTFPTKTEQQKIADCLSSLDDLVAAENEKLEGLKAHKKGLMQKLFPAEGKTVPEWRFTEFRDSGEWEETTLTGFSDFRRGSFPQPYGLPEWYDEKNGMPFIQVFDVGENLRLKPKTKNKISKLAAAQSVFIPAGTVIITIQGSIGRVAITQYDAYIDRTLLLFEKFHRETEKTFIAYTLKLLFDIEKQKAPGGIIKTITKEVLSDFAVKIPDIKEQHKISDCLSSIDDLITAQADKIEALKAHKKGLMQGLFPSTREVGV